MNRRVAWLLVVVAGCGQMPVEEEGAQTLSQELNGARAQVFQRLLLAQLDAARARCLLSYVEVGAPAQPRSADSALRLVPTSDPSVWATRGCGPSVTVARAPNATAASLRGELNAVAGDGASVIQGASGLYQGASGDQPVLEFSSAKGKEVTVELPFDGYERAQVTVAVTRLALGDAATAIDGLRPEDFAALTDAQRLFAFRQLASVVRSVAETAGLAGATATLLDAGPGRSVRTARQCTSLFVSYPCVDFTWVDAQQTP